MVKTSPDISFPRFVSYALIGELLRFCNILHICYNLMNREECCKMAFSMPISCIISWTRKYICVTRWRIFYQRARIHTMYASWMRLRVRPSLTSRGPAYKRPGRGLSPHSGLCWAATNTHTPESPSFPNHATPSSPQDPGVSWASTAMLSLARVQVQIIGTFRFARSLVDCDVCGHF